MIIISQDKKEILNFERITEIVVSENNICVSDGIKQQNGFIIATYKNEERAKEVLDEIIRLKVKFELYRLVPTGGKEQTEMLEWFTNKRIFIDTYFMPEE